MPIDTTPVLYLEEMAERSGMAMSDIPFRSVDALRGVIMAVPMEIQVVGDMLEWSLPGGLTDGWREGGAAEDALFDFLWLRDATAESVLRFAKKYGVLGVLDQNGLPGCAVNKLPGELPNGAIPKWIPDRIEGYRVYASNALAIVALSTALRDATTAISARDTLQKRGIPIGSVTPDSSSPKGSPHFVAFKDGELGYSAYHDRFVHQISTKTMVDNLDDEELGPRTLARQRQWLAHHVTRHWLLPANIAPSIRWDADVPLISLGLNTEARGEFNRWPPNTLFSVLAAQLAGFTCSQTGGRIGICQDCGRPYRRLRTPPAGDPERCKPCRLVERRKKNNANAKKRRAQGRKT